MSVTVESVVETFQKAFPESSFIVYISTGGFALMHDGTVLLNVKLSDGRYLLLAKVPKSSGPAIDGDELKAKAFPFIFDTKSEADTSKRSKAIRDSLKKMFPNYHVNVFVVNLTWHRHSHNVAGGTSFTKEYGSDVDIILS